MQTSLDFGYPWTVVYGHLVVTAVSLPLLLIGIKRKWAKLWLAAFGALALWSIAGFLIAQFGLRINSRMPLPTQAFLVSGSGRVLDMGAGSGRSALMVLENRPNTTVVALDSFGDQYVSHFGGGDQKPVVDVGRERLLANFKVAGVEKRATIQAGDMRQMPLEPASFDAIVSAYAIDHLSQDGAVAAIGEASRVLKPGGEFLLMVLTKDFWLKFAWGPIFMHTGLRGAAAWEQMLRDAGFEVVEAGTRPGTLYFLARKR